MNSAILRPHDYFTEVYTYKKKPSLEKMWTVYDQKDYSLQGVWEGPPTFITHWRYDSKDVQRSLNNTVRFSQSGFLIPDKSKGWFLYSDGLIMSSFDGDSVTGQQIFPLNRKFSVWSVTNKPGSIVTFDLCSCRLMCPEQKDCRGLCPTHTHTHK